MQMMISGLKWPCLCKGTPFLLEADPGSLVTHAEAAGTLVFVLATPNLVVHSYLVWGHQVSVDS